MDPTGEYPKSPLPLVENPEGGSPNLEENQPNQVNLTAVVAIASIEHGALGEHADSSGFVEKYKKTESPLGRANLLRETLEKGARSKDIAEIVVNTEKSVISLFSFCASNFYKRNPSFCIHCAKILAKRFPSQAADFVETVMDKNKDTLFCLSMLHETPDMIIFEPFIPYNLKTNEDIKNLIQRRRNKRETPLFVCKMLQEKEPLEALEAFEKLPSQMRENNMMVFSHLVLKMRPSAQIQHPSEDEILSTGEETCTSNIQSLIRREQLRSRFQRLEEEGPIPLHGSGGDIEVRLKSVTHQEFEAFLKDAGIEAGTTPEQASEYIQKGHKIASKCLQARREKLLPEASRKLSDKNKKSPLFLNELYGCSCVGENIDPGIDWDTFVENWLMTKDNCEAHSQGTLYSSFLLESEHMKGFSNFKDFTKRQCKRERQLEESLEKKGLLEKGMGYEGFSSPACDYKTRMLILRQSSRNSGPQEWLEGRLDYHCALTVLAEKGERSLGFRLEKMGKNLGKLHCDIYSVIFLLVQVYSGDIIEVADQLPEIYLNTIPVLLTLLDQAKQKDILELFSRFPKNLRENDYVMCRAIFRARPKSVPTFCKQFVSLSEVSADVKTTILMRVEGENLDQFVESFGSDWIDSEDLAFLLLERVSSGKALDMYGRLNESIQKNPNLVMLLLSRLYDSSSDQGLQQQQEHFWELIKDRTIPVSEMENIELICMLITHVPEGNLCDVFGTLCGALSAIMRKDFGIASTLTSRVTESNISEIWELLLPKQKEHQFLLKEVLCRSGPCEKALNIYRDLPENSRNTLRPWLKDSGWEDHQLTSPGTPTSVAEQEVSSSSGGATVIALGGATSASKSVPTPPEGDPAEKKALRKLGNAQKSKVVDTFKDLDPRLKNSEVVILKALEECLKPVKDEGGNTTGVCWDDVAKLYKEVPGNQKEQVAKAFWNRAPDEDTRRRLFLSRKIRKKLGIGEA